MFVGVVEVVADIGVCETGAVIETQTEVLLAIESSESLLIRLFSFEIWSDSELMVLTASADCLAS